MTEFCPTPPTVQEKVRGTSWRLYIPTYPLKKGSYKGLHPRGPLKKVYSDGFEKFGVYTDVAKAEAAIPAFWAAVCALEGDADPVTATPPSSGTKRRAPKSLKWRPSKAARGGGHGHRNEETYAKEQAVRRQRVHEVRRQWFKAHADELRAVRRNPARLVSNVLTLAPDIGPQEEVPRQVPLSIITEKQSQRLHDQCIALIHYFDLCAEKYGCKEQDYGDQEEGQEVGDEEEDAVYMSDLAARAGEVVWRSGRTVQRWYKSYLLHDCRFSLDGRGRTEHQWILNEEDLLLKFEKKCRALVKAEEPRFVDAVWEYLNNDLLKNEAAHLDKHGLSLPISRSTAWAWIHKIEDTAHQEASKHYYTDNHEKPEVVEYRRKYVERQMALELRKPVWVQVPIAKYEEIRSQLAQVDEGHHYKTADGESWVELHVDACAGFDKFRCNCALGGNFSVRWCRSTISPSADPAQTCPYNHAPGKCKCHLPLYHAGQDESIFKAYQRGKKSWKIKGFQALRKKSDGPGEMVSAFQDEIRGFGFPMSDDELAAVNTFRAAQNPPREPLKESPGIRFLKYGNSEGKEGYWNWDMFKEQVTDFLDCFDVLYPEMQLQMETDWSSGHAKMYEGALSANKMAAGYGGAQEAPRTTFLMTEGCVNTDTHKHLIGTEQVPPTAL